MSDVPASLNGVDPGLYLEFIAELVRPRTFLFLNLVLGEGMGMSSSEFIAFASKEGKKIGMW